MTALVYDGKAGRWAIDGHDLHAGDVLMVRIGPRWTPARIEYDYDGKRWVFIFPDGSIDALGEGMPVRRS